MQEEWWERPVCYLCDYWWLLPVLLAMGLAAFFSRDYWFPAQSPAATLTSEVPTMETPQHEAVSSTRYVDPQSGYSLEYPSDWQTNAVGNQSEQWYGRQVWDG